MNVQARIINIADKKKMTAEIMIDLCDLTVLKVNDFVIIFTSEIIAPHALDPTITAFEYFMGSDAAMPNVKVWWIPTQLLMITTHIIVMRKNVPGMFDVSIKAKIIVSTRTIISTIMHPKNRNRGVEVTEPL